MKKITQQEFDDLPVVDGIRQCPGNTNYSAVKEFGRCAFGVWCSFGNWSTFGEQCSFRDRCSFGGCCSFGRLITFGSWCSFGTECTFDEQSSFGEVCSFGNRCSFGAGCSFGEHSSFGTNCVYAGHALAEGYPLFAVAGLGSENRTTYFWNTEDGVFVQCESFFGSIEEFKQQVTKVHSGTKHEKLYLSAATMAEAQFE